jgi:pyruvate dehydrogenase E1 component alpha subunit
VSDVDDIGNATEVTVDPDPITWHVDRREDLLPSDTPVQLLDEYGVYHPHEQFPLSVTDDEHRAMYRHMVMARRVDDESIKLQRQGQLAVYTSSLGQEGAQVGSATALRADDWAFPSYREHAVARVRGVDPSELLHHSRGTWVSVHDPREHRFASQTVSIGSHLVHAAGLAVAAKFDGTDTAAIAYFGDGATSEGSSHEGMNFAAVFSAPVVFFCQNNGWAISVPVTAQTAAPTLAHKAIGYGMPGVRIDGNDVLASLAVTRWALDRARRGEGPTFVEALTYRMEAHSTSDDATRYRPQEDLPAWARKDPIDRYTRFLTKAGLLDDEFVAGVEADAKELCTRVRADVYDAPHDRPDEVFDHVFATPTPRLEAQRAHMLREIAAREDQS